MSVSRKSPNPSDAEFARKTALELRRQISAALAEGRSVNVRPVYELSDGSRKIEIVIGSLPPVSSEEVPCDTETF